MGKRQEWNLKYLISNIHISFYFWYFYPGCSNLPCIYIYIYAHTHIWLFIYINIWLCVLVAQLYLTHYNLMDWSLPGSSVCGVLQARILEWVAISYSQNIRLFIYKYMIIYIYIISSQIDFSLLRESLKIFRFDVSFSFYFISNQN